jgi:hypothetical protein
MSSAVGIHVSEILGLFFQVTGSFPARPWIRKIAGLPESMVSQRSLPPPEKVARKAIKSLRPGRSCRQDLL